MRADNQRSDEQTVANTTEAIHRTKQMIALTDDLVKGSKEAIRSSRTLLERTAHLTL